MIWFYQPVVQLLGYWPYVFQIFFVLVTFLYMPPVLGLLQFTHSLKAAFTIWCFHLTTEFQPGMLNVPSFFSPVVLIAEDAAEAEH